MESTHRVSVAIVDSAGRLRAFAGDPDLVTFARSAIKPIQAIPLIDDGAAAKYQLTDAEIALCCASHSGEPEHVAGVAGLLRRLGLDGSALACGVHWPMGRAAADALRAAGPTPDRLHNNCSGKHAGMLALARGASWPVAGYEKLTHPVQQRMVREVSSWTGLPIDAMPTAVDGCGVITFALALRAMAGAFGRLAYGAKRRGSAPGRVLGAMASWPVHVGGSDRLCTRLMQAAGGRIVVKTGAEGLFCAAVPGAELGIALKVEDGATRASGPALMAVLRTLDLIGETEMVELAEFAEPVIRNTRDERVGSIVAAIVLEAGA